MEVSAERGAGRGDPAVAREQAQVRARGRVSGSRGRMPNGRAAWPGQGVESPSPTPPPS